MTVRGLLVDFGGVLTTDVFASFELFCAEEGLPADTVKNLFRTDPAARDLLIGLEDGTLPDAVRSARRHGIRTGLVSNSWGVGRYDRQLLAELFDGVVISAEVGLRKPAPEIYALGAQAVGLPPAECVYVDDIGGNLKPAKALGMTTVLHKDTATTIASLSTLLGVPL